jgi:hypothetical protein
MKTNNNQQSIVKMEKEELQQLCNEVKESIATEADLKNMKHHFGVADLWNIQKLTRHRVQRRQIL